MVSIYNLGCYGGGSLVTKKNIMTIVCKWGGYFQNKKYRLNNNPLTLQQQVPVAAIKFDGTNRNAEHPVTIFLKNSIEIIPNELML
jgi:hypothetical protein